LAKPILKATCLVHLGGFFHWKAEKSPNKHPLSSFVQCPEVLTMIVSPLNMYILIVH
jgi:hypothetical protein